MTTLTLFALSAVFVAQDVRNDYEPTWASLETHPTPTWFEDGKFGIFIHWGVYSVPSFCDTSTYSEWYQCWLDNNSHNGLEREFHEKNYGADFEYREFAPMFRAEMWDPAEWASIFKRAGAEYVVLTSKHHDGYALWPSEEASEARGYAWNAMETGPKRDLIGELFDALRAEGVRPGLYYSFMEWHNPLYDNDKPRYVEEVMVPQIKDIITRYQPDVFWPDGEWDHPDTLWRSTEILDWIYDNCDNPDSIVVNDRWGKGLRGQVGDYTTTEYDSLGNSSGQGMRKHRPFEECRGIGHSFAFNRAENYDIYDSREASVRKLIDLVSKGGVLLLDVGPTADGRIPLIMVDRLLAIGDWLKINGEAIKGADRSPFTETPWGRATAKGDVVYLHIYDWPANDRLDVVGLATEISAASMLGDRVDGRVLGVSTSNNVQSIDLSGLHPLPHATVIRCQLAGPPVTTK
jgi:alpha-L-fucosidase